MTRKAEIFSIKKKTFYFICPRMKFHSSLAAFKAEVQLWLTCLLIVGCTKSSTTQLGHGHGQTKRERSGLGLCSMRP